MMLSVKSIHESWTKVNNPELKAAVNENSFVEKC